MTYTLTGDYELLTEMKAVPAKKSTPISLAQHTYWNLSGHGNGDILGHNVCIKADYITPVDNALIPTGEMLSVNGTPFDFRKPHEMLVEGMIIILYSMVTRKLKVVSIWLPP